VSGLYEALAVTGDRKVTELREFIPYFVHFLFIKENIGEQTLESCWPSLPFLLPFFSLPLPLHSLPTFIVPTE
jgi:hypothetical protein